MSDIVPLERKEVHLVFEEREAWYEQMENPFIPHTDRWLSTL
jgi:hypothetical protein